GSRGPASTPRPLLRPGGRRAMRCRRRGASARRTVRREPPRSGTTAPRQRSDVGGDRRVAVPPWFSAHQEDVPLLIRVGHSPDPDDAFMVWALAEGVVHAEDFDVELVPKDIETLNQWAAKDARLEVSALSAAAFARVADKYWLLPH